MKIIYQTETGISIVHPTGEVPIEAVLQKDVPNQYRATAKIVDDDVIPTDRTFRDAWVLNGGKIIEDISIAKEIHKDRLRADRKILLEELDAQEMISNRKGGDTDAIRKEKDRLCDITKLVDRCLTVDEIKSIKIYE